jgi:CHAT domain-containing protein
MSIRVVLILFFCNSLFTRVVAQPATFDQDYAMRQLNRSLAQYMVSYKDLLNTRGYPEPYSFLEQNYLGSLSALYFNEELNYRIRPREISKGDSTMQVQLKFLYYSFTGDTIKMWLAGKDTLLFFHERPLDRSGLVNAVNNLRTYLGSKSLASRGTGVALLRDKRKNELNVLSQDLSELLLPPGLTRHFNEEDHIIIIPEFIINQVPFYMLRCEGELLIDRVVISMAPAILDQTRYEKLWRSRMIGDEVAFSFEDPLVVGNPAFDKALGYASLPGAEREALAVAKKIDAVPAIGGDATYGSLSQKIENSDFLYFATHGRSTAMEAMDSSFILLAPDNIKRTGKWTARDIMNTDFEAEMVVMSACETGFGQLHEGGIIGLPSAFYLAGIPHSVLSYWPVSDQQTAVLMQQFLEELQIPRHGFPSRHLREAILEFREENPDPRDWAAFMVFGYPY